MSDRSPYLDANKETVDKATGWYCWADIGIGIVNTRAIGKLELSGKKPRFQAKTLSGYKDHGKRRKTL